MIATCLLTTHAVFRTGSGKPIKPDKPLTETSWRARAMVEAIFAVEMRAPFVDDDALQSQMAGCAALISYQFSPVSQTPHYSPSSCRSSLFLRLLQSPMLGCCFILLTTQILLLHVCCSSSAKSCSLSSSHRGSQPDSNRPSSVICWTMRCWPVSM